MDVCDKIDRRFCHIHAHPVMERGCRLRRAKAFPNKSLRLSAGPPGMAIWMMAPGPPVRWGEMTIQKKLHSIQ